MRECNCKVFVFYKDTKHYNRDIKKPAETINNRMQNLFRLWVMNQHFEFFFDCKWDCLTNVYARVNSTLRPCLLDKTNNLYEVTITTHYICFIHIKICV